MPLVEPVMTTFFMGCAPRPHPRPRPCCGHDTARAFVHSAAALLLIARRRECWIIRAAGGGIMAGKVVVVTGSTRGIGKGLAREFLKRGHSVVVSGRTRDA